MEATKGGPKLTGTSFEAALMRARDHIGAALSVQQLLCLVAVFNAGRDGLEQGALIETYGLGRSHVSKTVQDLSNLTSSKEPGPDLIHSQIDLMNRRLRLLYCTDKGRMVMHKILGEVK